jgi:hypothetical protein
MSAPASSLRLFLAVLAAILAFAAPPARAQDEAPPA